MTSVVEPLRDPLGDSHHTDVPFTPEDEEMGRLLARGMGSLFSDVEEIGNPNCRYWYHERTSVDEWRRVARALRVHGLKIVKATGMDAEGATKFIAVGWYDRMHCRARWEPGCEPAQGALLFRPEPDRGKP